MPELILSANGEQAAQQPQPLPPPNYHVSPDGVVITIPYAPATAMQHLISPAIMRQIVQQWREIERMNADMTRIAQDAIRTKR